MILTESGELTVGVSVSFEESQECDIVIRPLLRRAGCAKGVIRDN